MSTAKFIYRIAQKNGESDNEKPLSLSGLEAICNDFSNLCAKKYFSNAPDKIGLCVLVFTKDPSETNTLFPIPTLDIEFIFETDAGPNGDLQVYSDKHITGKSYSFPRNHLALQSDIADIVKNEGFKHLPSDIANVLLGPYGAVRKEESARDYFIRKMGF